MVKQLLNGALVACFLGSAVYAEQATDGISPTWESLSERYRVPECFQDGILEKEIAQITLMGSEEEIQWEQTTEGLKITKPDAFPLEIANGFKISLK